LGQRGDVWLVSADELCIEVTTRIPCTDVNFGGARVADYGVLGIVPMGVTGFTSALNAASGVADGLLAAPIYSNMPRALWDTAPPAPDNPDTLIANALTGISLTCVKRDPEGVTPPYDMAVLCANEPLNPHNCAWSNPAPIEPKSYPAEDIFGQIERTIADCGDRQTLLDAMATALGTRRETQLSNWAANLDQTLLAIPKLRVVGAEVTP
jgi:hypothetical protein